MQLEIDAATFDPEPRTIGDQAWKISCPMCSWQTAIVQGSKHENHRCVYCPDCGSRDIHIVHLFDHEWTTITLTITG